MKLRFALILLAAVAASTTNADLIFNIGSTSIAPGGNATIDVFISSDIGSVSFQSIDVEFYIASESPAFPYIEPEFSQTDSESFASDPSYAFFQNSEAMTSGTPITRSDANGFGFDRLFFEDSTSDGTNLTLDEGQSLLLAQLELSHNNPDGEERTFFVSVSGSVLDASGGFVATGGNFGRIDVVAVPEPSSMLATSLGFGVVAASFFRRRKRNA